MRVRGTFVPLSALSSEQQTLLSAVPRWKRAWVRPTTLKEGQNPSYKVCKWVIDRGKGEEQGTVEEMANAARMVASGEAATLPVDATDSAIDATNTTTAVTSEVGTPMEVERGASQSRLETPALAGSSTAPITAGATASTSAADTPVSTLDAAAREAPEPGEASVAPVPPPTDSRKPDTKDDATEAQSIEQDASVMMQELEETQKKADTFQEDEVQLAKEATDGMAVDQ